MIPSSVKLYHVGTPIEDRESGSDVWTFSTSENAMAYGRTGAVWEIEVPTSLPQVQQAIAAVRESAGYTAMGRVVPGVPDPFRHPETLQQLDRIVLKKEDCGAVRLFSDRGHPEWAKTDADRRSDATRAANSGVPSSGAPGDGPTPPMIDTSLALHSGGTADATRAANSGVPTGPTNDDFGGDAGRRWREIQNRKDNQLPVTPDEEREWFETGTRLGTIPPGTPPPAGAGAPAPPAPPGGPSPAAASLPAPAPTQPGGPPPRPPVDAGTLRDVLGGTSGAFRGTEPPDDNKLDDYDLSRHPNEPTEVKYGMGMNPPGESERAQSPTAGYDRPTPVIVVGPRPLHVTVDNLRDALGKQGREARDPEPGKEPRVGPSLLDVLSGASAGQSQSGANLAGLMRRAGGIGSRVRERGRQLGAKWWKGSKTGPKTVLGRKIWGTPKFSAAGKFTGNVGGLFGAAEGAAGAGAGAAGGAAAALGPIGLAAGAITTLGIAAVEAGKAVYAFARAQEQEIRRLAEVGGDQAAAVAALDASRVQRDIKTAGETGGTSQDLIESLNKFEEALQPIESMVTNLANAVGGEILDAVSGLLPIAEEMMKVVVGIYNLFAIKKIKPPGQREQQQFAIDAMRTLQQEQERLGRPQFPAGPRG